MKTLVLGGSGFIGAHLVKQLAARGHEVRGFSRHKPGNIGPETYTDWILGSVEDGDLLRNAFRGISTCYHLISTTVPKTANVDPLLDVKSNLCGTLSILNAAVEAGVSHFVFASSGGTVYGEPQHLPIQENHPLNPIGSYGIVKVAIEHYLSLYRAKNLLDCRIARLSNPFGPGQRATGSQGVVAVFINKIMRGEPIQIWGDGSAMRDYIYISDAVDGLIKVGQHPNAEGGTFNIGSGKGRSVADIISRIEEATRKSADVRFLPSSGQDVARNILSIEKARDQLAFQPAVSFEEGIVSLYEDLRTQE